MSSRIPVPRKRTHTIYDPALVILASGRKDCRVGDRTFSYGVGQYMALFLPMSIEVEIREVTADAPMLMAGIKIDLNRVASMLLQMDQGGHPMPKGEIKSASGIYTKPMTDDLLDAICRLLRTTADPLEQAVLSDAILQEIYFRIIRDDDNGTLQHLLQQRGQIQQISKAVDHIHKHMDEPVSVDDLAGLVNMSTSGFHRSFKEVMHMSPLQYAKSIKLFRAQTLIRQGKNASEAGYMVGYNSPAQFSREYKRHFGFSPSAT